MQRLTIEPGIVEKLKSLREPAVICDELGHVIGYFAPTPAVPGDASPNSTEELLRRAAEGGGRPLQEILADLEASA